MRRTFCWRRTWSGVNAVLSGALTQHKRACSPSYPIGRWARQKMEEDGTDQLKGADWERERETCTHNKPALLGMVFVIVVRIAPPECDTSFRTFQLEKCRMMEWSHSIKIWEQYKHPPKFKWALKIPLPCLVYWVLTQQKFPAGEIPLLEVNRGEAKGG